MTALAASFSAIRVRLATTQHLTHPKAAVRNRSAIQRSLVGPVLYGIGTVTSLWSAQAAFVLYAAVPVFFTLSRRTSNPPSS